jgi:hypothetical protein
VFVRYTGYNAGLLCSPHTRVAQGHCHFEGVNNRMTDIFRGYAQSFQADALILPYRMPRHIPYTTFTVHHSLILILSYCRFRNTFETVEGLCRMLPVTVLMWPDTGKDDDELAADVVK